ncbi:MAG: TfoX family protein [Deltaproteobacteria bacterium]|nr:TfoX family protein [Deltaproteobacteria bacterium]
MAYDRTIEHRIDALIADWGNLEKKKMFGGVCYLTGGNICFGIWRDELIVRTDPATAGRLLSQEHVRPFDVTGRAMKGWLMVAAGGWPTDDDLERWLALGRDFARTLPEK